MTISEKVDQLLDRYPDADPNELAAALIASVNKKDLIPIVADHIMFRQRNRVRSIEHRFADHFRERFMSGEPDSTPVDLTELTPLFKESFRMGNGKPPIVIGEATLEELQIRREMLLKKRDGLDRTITFLDWAISTLETTGARCLNDLAGAAT